MEDEVTNQEAAGNPEEGGAAAWDDARKAALKAAVEAIVYVTQEPVTIDQIAAALAASSAANGGAEAVKPDVSQALVLLQGEYQRPDRGLEIREIAGGYKMFTKPEHHETIRQFVRNLTPPLKLSMAALETLATIAYRQPVTVPEIQQIRGVNASGVLKTLLDRKLITTAGRKNVIGRPILYKTTREFLVKFGLSSLSDLPTLEEFEELARAALGAAAFGSEDSSETAAEAPSEEASACEPELASTPGDHEPETASPQSEPQSSASTDRNSNGA